MPEAPVIRFIRDDGGDVPIAVTRVSVSRSHGIAPAPMIADIIPISVDDFSYGSRTGSLVVEYEGARLQIKDCIIDASSAVASPSTRVSTITILDKRWKWRYGELFGHYNRRTESGRLLASKEARFLNNVIFNSEASPRRLAHRCLAEMREIPGSIDLDAFPDDTGPEMDWYAANPARELAQLCEWFGVRLIMKWNNSLEFFKLGEARGDTANKKKWADKFERAAERRAQRLARLAGGTNPPLPDVMPVITYSESVDVAERPDAISIVTSPILYQWDLELEAVGEEEDGTVKLLKDLSFAPDNTRSDGGFVGPDGIMHPSTGGHPAAEDEDTRRLIAKSVMKWFRVKTPFTIPSGVGAESLLILDLAEIKPIFDTLADTTVEDGLIVAKPMIVYGKYFDGEDNNVTTVVPLPDDFTGKVVGGVNVEDMIIPGGYSLDSSKGILKFRQPLFAINTADDSYTVPTIRMRASFSRRDPSHAQWVAGEIVRQQPAPNLGTNAMVIERPELTPTRTFHPINNFTRVTFRTNEPEIDELANEHIDAIEQIFTPRRPTTIVFAGFYPQIELDGVIRTVSFNIDVDNGVSPITTTVELDHDVPAMGQLSYVELRQHERILRLRDKYNIQTALTWRRRMEREAEG